MAGKTVVLDGDCQLIIPSAGELGVVTAIRKPYPTYTGETTVTPSDDAQVLHTELQTLINDITVEAIPGDYVGSDIPRRDSSDVAASGATVTAPAGYYEAEATKTIQSGTEGTPTATKGAVSNHAVSVTPSVTNTEGYINGGTKSGTAVTVSASELVSGTKEITENGSGIDVTNYAAVDVDIPAPAPELQSKTNINPTTSSQTIEPDPGYDGLSSVQINAMPNGTEGTPTAAKSAVSNHSVSVTPSVTNTAGYISGGTKTGAAVTVTAAELESGAKAITANGNGQDVTGYAAVDVNVPNSYTASDEGKVVNNSALVAQASATYTNNGTYDTTLKNSVTVDVPSQTPVINPLSVTENGTYTAPAGVDGYSPVTVNVSGGGLTIDDIAMREYGPVLYGASATEIARGAFCYNSKITEASFPNALVIGEYAFDQCANLSNVSFPKATEIGSMAFRSCYALTSVFSPLVETVGRYAFFSCSSLSNVSLPAATAINDNTFQGCGFLEIDLPLVTTIGTSAFCFCSRLSKANLPLLNNVNSYAFTSCGSLRNVSLPMAGIIGASAFSGCYSLTSLSLPKISSIAAYAFNKATRLVSLYLNDVTSVPRLVHSTAFASTPIGGYSASARQYGSIYVPASLYDSFLTASNWSYFSSRMVSV